MAARARSRARPERRFCTAATATYAAWATAPTVGGMPEKALFRSYGEGVPVHLRSVALAADDPAAEAAFWAALLDREAVTDHLGLLLPGDERQLGLRFVPLPAPRTALTRMHLHLTSRTLRDQHARVAAALRLGARHLDVGQRPEEGHVVLADRAGNDFCVIESGNGFLAGCGPLGELACDGSREVGLFWSSVLGWPLVWDQDQETAIQSPYGGTKVAWGGPPVLPVDPAEPQYLDLVVVDGTLSEEVRRLVALGATRRGDDGGDVAVLADPDGLLFRLSGQ